MYRLLSSSSSMLVARSRLASPSSSGALPLAGRRLFQSWVDVNEGPPDPILGITQAFQKDKSSKKINLGVGAYRGNDGKPYILPTVREAESRIFERNMDHEYAGINGVPAFVKVAQELAFGQFPSVLDSGRLVTAQAISGTGALRIAGAFLSRHLPKGKKVFFLPTPTWANHNPIFEDSGFELGSYRYYKPETCGLDLDGLLEDVDRAPNGSVMLFHACAHNPTGVDPTVEQWKQISAVCKKKNHFVLFDAAYQGFASGDTNVDIQSVQTFVNDGHNVALCQSFAKNFGLYGERVGAFSLLCRDAAEAMRVDSQLKIIIRPMYSNPPIHGARIVAEILGDSGLKAEWFKEVEGMANRIKEMRADLVSNLAKHGSTRDWSHITNQIGMFCFSGLTPFQVDNIREEHHVYMTRNGRISIAGVTSSNNDTLAAAMHAVAQ
eukprot:TRINITY_DN13038_c0_g1_i1.p1 TRINITY_DN13038_c0_g1~~TRINITY_DN13038_c0_g1_i1.p1  ORF type:complete len:437 (-),score=107.83 TRINITY_DN13038_c0_g1_i1:343-1653(-)